MVPWSAQLLDQCNGFLEARMPRGLKPLKHDHLHSDDFCAGPSHPLKCDLLAFGTARAHGVADDKDAPAGLDEREHRLQYTDVRLPSADDRVAAWRQALKEVGRAYGAERHLGQDRRWIRSELGHGWPESLRILFGEQDGRADEPGRVDKRALASVAAAWSIAGMSFAWKSMRRSVEVSARMIGMASPH